MDSEEEKKEERERVREIVPERLINRVRGKKDLYELLSTYGKQIFVYWPCLFIAQYQMPSYKQATVKFMRSVLKGEKRVSARQNKPEYSYFRWMKWSM